MPIKPPRLIRPRPAPALIVKPDPRASKIPVFSTDRNVAQVSAPATDTGKTEMRYRSSTFFVQPGPAQIIYNGDRTWARVTLTLRTAGPVAVGTQATIVPVLSGQAPLLQPGVAAVFDLAKSNLLYVAANGVNRIDVTIAPFPWLEEITGRVGALLGGG